MKNEHISDLSQKCWQLHAGLKIIIIIINIFFFFFFFLKRFQKWKVTIIFWLQDN